MSGSYFGNTNLFRFDNFIYPPLYAFDVFGQHPLQRLQSHDALQQLVNGGVHRGGRLLVSPDYLPTGGQLYATGAGTNPGDYSNQTADQLIAATHTAPNYATEVKDLFKYENYISENLPMVEQPAGLVQLTMYKRDLLGLLPQGIGNQFFPQFYRLG